MAGIFDDPDFKKFLEKKIKPRGIKFHCVAQREGGIPEGFGTAMEPSTASNLILGMTLRSNPDYQLPPMPQDWRKLSAHSDSLKQYGMAVLNAVKPHDNFNEIGYVSRF